MATLAAVVFDGVKFVRATDLSGTGIDAGASVTLGAAVLRANPQTGVLEQSISGGPWVAVSSGAALTSSVVKTHNGFGSSELVIETGAVSTTGATSGAVYSLTLSDLTHYNVEISVTCRASDGAERGFWVRRASAYREGGGAVVASDIPAFHAVSSGLTGASVAVVAAGNAVQAQVTGVAGKTISWVCHVRRQGVSQ